MNEPSGRDLTPEELMEHEQALDMDNLDIEPYGGANGEEDADE